MYKEFILNRTKSLLICCLIFSSCELFSLGCGAAFDSSALSFRIKSGMTKENYLVTCIIPYGGIKNMSSKIMDSVFINLSNYMIVSCRV